MDTANNLQKAKEGIEKAIRRECGAEIEWTMIGLDDSDRMSFSICGKPDHVERAKPFFAKWRQAEQVHDEELGETFAYFTK